MRRVIFHPEASREIEQAFAWYEERVTGLGRKFFSEVEAAVNAIQDSPDTWPNYAAGARRFLVHRFPFAIIYRRNEDVIQVAAVMHLKRRPGYWARRKF